MNKRTTWKIQSFFYLFNVIGITIFNKGCTLPFTYPFVYTADVHCVRLQVFVWKIWNFYLVVYYFYIQNIKKKYGWKFQGNLWKCLQKLSRYIVHIRAQSICFQNIEREKYFKVTLVPVESFSPVSYALIIYKRTSEDNIY